MTAPICFIDTETDGLHPGRKAWEVAMIRRDATGEHRIQFFIDIDLETADPYGLQVGRFYERHPYGRYLAGEIPDFVFGIKDDGGLLRPRDAAHTIARYTHGAHLIGNVPSFDAEVLANLLREQHLTPAWHYQPIDVEAVAAGWLIATEAQNMRRARLLDPDIRFKPSVTALTWHSDGLSRALGVEPPADDERHTAMGDALWAMRMWDRINADAPSAQQEVPARGD